MFNFKFLFLLLIGTKANANFSYSLDAYGFVQKYQVSDSIINIDNQIFKLPQDEINLDLRSELKWKTGLNQVVVRPRLEANNKKSLISKVTEEVESKSELDLTDAYWEKYWSNNFSTTMGLQVYQWGPAEFINSSNPLFHFNSKQKSLVYKEKGKVLIRGNYSFNKLNSIVAIVEPMTNSEPEWIAEEVFKPKGLIKFERIGDGTSNLLGIVSGIEEKSNFFVGEYFNWSPAEGATIYADIKHSQNRINYIPLQSGPFVNLEEPDQDPRVWSTLAVVGLRWESDFDFRAEYIYNGMGFDRDELNLVILATANPVNPFYIRNLQRFQKIGLELLGQQYSYFSYRINEPFKFKEFNFYIRHIVSLQDNSAQSQFEFDKLIFDEYSVFGSYSNSIGALDSEFKLLNDWHLLFGVKWGI